MRWVIDASAAAEYLLRTPLGRSIAPQLDPAELVAPELLDAEVLSVLRKEVQRGVLDEERAREAIDDLRGWDVRRVPHRWLLEGAWSFRHNTTVYDALYLALARADDIPVLTADGPLARIPVGGVVVHDVRMWGGAG
ncbi:MAG: type II toxin-antitoxin system VapC family toxin [Myxococcota bacterium]